MKEISIVDDPELLVGISTSDDAAVYKLRDDLAIVQTVDYFAPIVDDPYWFGAITVANSLSDIYAMGAKPIIALNLVGFPSKSLPLDILSKILKGGYDKAKEAGVNIVGGHTIDDPEPKYGLSVTGIINPNNVITNSGAKPKDLIILTKPLGIGIITTGIKGKLVEKEIIDNVINIMVKLNKEASESMVEYKASACTDVTGFGLLGHLYEMTSASKVGANIYVSKIPVIEGTLPLVSEGIAPGGAYSNKNYLSNNVIWDSNISQDMQIILYDPQTSGGLIIAIHRDRANSLLSNLISKGIDAQIIGEFVDSNNYSINVLE